MLQEAFRDECLHNVRRSPSEDKYRLGRPSRSIDHDHITRLNVLIFRQLTIHKEESKI